MMTYYIPSFDVICDFPVLHHCYDVVQHEKKLQQDPYVMAVRAQLYWAFESKKPLDLEKIHKFLSNQSFGHITAAYNASTNQMYGTPSEFFIDTPFYAIPNQLLNILPGPEID